MIHLYPFMLYPGVVLAHSEFPEDQWSLLSPEGIFCSGRTLFRQEYVALWQNGPNGQIFYEAINPPMENQGLVKYRFLMAPGNDVIDIKLTLTNLENQPWKEVMVDICLMDVRAPHFYDPDYTRTFVVTHKGLSPVAEFLASPQRPVFRKAGRTGDSMHFFGPPNTNWIIMPEQVVQNIVITQSVDRKWTVGFGWEELSMVACNSDLAHGCIHADPHLGDIDPGRSVTVAGKIYITAQSPEKVLDRFEMEMKFT
ncbi:MAG: hypothetical protein WC975_10300 [Phycisphaerae bacterium]